MDPAYAAPGTEGYAEGAPADQQYTEGEQTRSYPDKN